VACRLRSAEEIAQAITFFNNGPNPLPGLIVERIQNTTWVLLPPVAGRRGHLEAQCAHRHVHRSGTYHGGVHRARLPLARRERRPATSVLESVCGRRPDMTTALWSCAGVPALRASEPQGLPPHEYKNRRGQGDTE
jgi:hypothetical protein